MHYYHKKLLNDYQTHFLTMERKKVSKSTLYWRCIDKLSPLVLYLAWSLISNKNEEICLFPLDSHIYMFHQIGTRQKFQFHLLGQSWFTLIQSATLHDCFSLAHCKLVCFCFSVSAGFSIHNSHFIPLISYSSVTNNDFCFCPFVFHFFCYAFSIFKGYCLDFSILTLWRLP